MKMDSIWKAFLTGYLLEILTCISVYGYVLYFCGAPIGKSVTLSSPEAEYYVTSEIAKEVIFAKSSLEEIGI
jgi:ABC-type sulfate transport system permease component